MAYQLLPVIHHAIPKSDVSVMRVRNWSRKATALVLAAKFSNTTKSPMKRIVVAVI